MNILWDELTYKVTSNHSWRLLWILSSDVVRICTFLLDTCSCDTPLYNLVSTRLYIQAWSALATRLTHIILFWQVKIHTTFLINKLTNIDCWLLLWVVSHGTAPFTKELFFFDNSFSFLYNFTILLTNMQYFPPKTYLSLCPELLVRNHSYVLQTYSLDQRLAEISVFVKLQFLFLD